MRGLMKRAMVETMDTSICRPMPVRPRSSRAARVARAMSCPASRSAAGVPTFCGGRSASPVRCITPE